MKSKEKIGFLSLIILGLLASGYCVLIYSLKDQLNEKILWICGVLGLVAAVLIYRGTKQFFRAG
jgi:high-affinity Fe2+/Pb2+ permease